jgi:filamentous hemagglutinin family protein
MVFKGKVDQDLGGNRWLFNLPSGITFNGGTRTNLHSFFDAVGDKYGNEVQRMLRIL